MGLGMLLWVKSHHYQTYPTTKVGEVTVGVWVRSIRLHDSPWDHIFSFTRKVGDRVLDYWGPWDRTWHDSGPDWLCMKGEEQTQEKIPFAKDSV